MRSASFRSRGRTDFFVLIRAPAPNRTGPGLALSLPMEETPTSSYKRWLRDARTSPTRFTTPSRPLTSLPLGNGCSIRHRSTTLSPCLKIVAASNFLRTLLRSRAGDSGHRTTHGRPKKGLHSAGSRRGSASVRTGQNTIEPILSSQRAERQASNRDFLNEAQRRSIQEVLTSTDRVHGLQGGPAPAPARHSKPHGEILRWLRPTV
jgi:hypothetical protein